MKYFFWSLPSLMLFGLPWVHRLAWENVRLAIPDISANDAHGVVIFVGFFAMIAAAMMAEKYFTSRWR